MLRIVAHIGLGAVSWGGWLRAQPSCAPCHPKEATAHAATHHARSLRPAAETEFFRNLPGGPIGEARGGFLYSYERVGQGIRITAARGNQEAGAFSEWAFGAGDQGVTLVARAGTLPVEHRISYYPRAGRFDLTLGHVPGISRSPVDALGIVQPNETLRSCFGCHASISDGPLTVIEPGVTCARCHPGSEEHARKQGKVANPGKMTAEQQVTLCATCHRLTSPGKDTDPLNIRFQPLRLVRSQCYQEGQLACGRCHEAHQNAVRKDAAFYRGRCLSCHPGQAKKGNCIECHMPKSSPAPYLTFTDHWIR